MGATVIMACRNVPLAEKVAEEIKIRHPTAKIIVGPQLDLTDQDSVHNFAAAYKSNKWPLHVLINNAGTNHWGEPFYTKQGIGGLCQVNHLGAYTLTRLLEEKLQESAPSRVINISSIMHRLGSVGSEPSTYLTNWHQGSQYASTKLANVLFAFELQRRLAKHGVVTCAVDPGGVKSGIWKGGAMSRPPLKYFVDAFYAPSNDGASVVIHAATVPWNEDRKQEEEIGGPEDLRFYARGLFASPTITHTLGSPEQGILLLPPVVKRLAWGLNAVVHSALDWPVRWISGKRLGSKTKLVPANPIAYDRDLSRAVWELSAKAAGVPIECQLVGSKDGLRQ